jgi:hypothetical protein
LIIGNNGATVPREKYVNWGDVTKDGGRAWILPQSGVHDFAAGAYVFQFEEIQIYGNGHFAVLNPENINVIDAEVSGNVDNFNGIGNIKPNSSTSCSTFGTPASTSKQCGFIYISIGLSTIFIV